MNITTPQWYLDIKANGATPEELKQQIRHYLAEAALRRTGEQVDPATLDAALIELTFEGYEHGLSESGAQ